MFSHLEKTFFENGILEVGFSITIFHPEKA